MEPITALLMGGTSLASGILGNKASASAGRKALAMQMAALEEQRAARRQAQANIQQGVGYTEPYRQAGSAAVGTLENLYGLNGRGSQDAAFSDFQFAPDYQVRMRQGMGAIDQSAINRGMNLSGSHMKGAMKFGADLGTQGYGQYVQGLGGLASMGQTGVGQANSLLGAGAGLVQNNANAMAGIYNNMGNIASNSAMGQNSATQGTLQNLMGLMMYNQGRGGANTGSAYGAGMPMNIQPSYYS